MPLGEILIRRDGVVRRELAFVPPLVGVDVVERRGVLQPRRLRPVGRKRDSRPRRLRRQLLLTDVVVQPAAVLADAARQHQPDDAGAVDQVVVVPVVDARPDDDAALPLGLRRRRRPLAGELDHRRPVDAGVLLLPSGGVDLLRVVVVGGVLACQSPAHPELRHQQVVDGGNQDLAVGRVQPLCRHAAQLLAVTCEVEERDLRDLVVAVEKRENRIDLLPVDAVLQFQIPLPFLRLPPVTHRALRHARLARRGVPHEELPVAVLNVGVALEAVGADQPAGNVLSVAFLEFHQEGRIGVALGVVEEVGRLLLGVELLENHVVDRHPEGAVLPRVQGDPPVGELRDLAEVGRQHHQLRPAVPRLGHEVHIGRAGHVQVGAHHAEVLAVVPVGAFRHVRLLAPDLRRGIRQVGVPIVEAQVHPAEELQEPRPAGVAQHRHGWNGREADDAIGTVRLCRMQAGSRDDLQDLVPRGPPEPALAARLAELLALPRVGLNGRPGVDGVGVMRLRLAPQVLKRAAEVGVLHPERAVEVPRERDAALTTTRLVRW